MVGQFMISRSAQGDNQKKFWRKASILEGLIPALQSNRKFFISECGLPLCGND
jgi:hypothetical protein